MDDFDKIKQKDSQLTAKFAAKVSALGNKLKEFNIIEEKSK